MVQDIYDKFYRGVPQEQKERLKSFRSTHPRKHLRVGDTTWEYVSCGQGNDALLLLAGGTGDAEGMVLALAALENEYRLVSPTYPPLATIEQLVKGIVAILDAEDIHSVDILGQSFGGMLAQVIARQYPERLNRLILSHTLTTSPPVDRAIVLKAQKERERFLKIVPFLPLGVMRYISRKRLARHIATIDTEEREFWKAYFREMLSDLTREYLVANFQWTFDFFPELYVLQE